MLKLVMGSCRIIVPLQALPDVLLYPGGHVHSSGQFLQAIRIMTGDLVIPEELEPYAFGGNGTREEKRVDLDCVRTVILELCSAKQYRYGGFILHNRYPQLIESRGLTPLADIELYRESREEVLSNLDLLRAELPGREFVVYLQNNLPQIRARYMLADVASEWCSRTSSTLIDATAIIAHQGAATCLLVKDGAWDYQHYTNAMHKNVLRAYEEGPRRAPRTGDYAIQYLTEGPARAKKSVAASFHKAATAVRRTHHAAKLWGMRTRHTLRWMPGRIRLRVRPILSRMLGERRLVAILKRVRGR